MRFVVLYDNGLEDKKNGKPIFNCELLKFLLRIKKQYIRMITVEACTSDENEGTSWSTHMTISRFCRFLVKLFFQFFDVGLNELLLSG